MDFSALLIFIVVLVFIIIGIDSLVKKMNQHSLDNEISNEIPETEEDEKEEVIDNFKKIQSKGVFSMKKTSLRRIVKFIILFFVLGFSVVIEKTIRAEGLSERSGLDFSKCFNIVQPYFSVTIVLFLLWFFIYSKWANENIWIKEKSESISKDNEGLNENLGNTKEKNLNSNDIEKDTIDRDEAIKRIKEAKDLFDTGILNQEEYDELVIKYKAIIMAN